MKSLFKHEECLFYESHPHPPLRHLRHGIMIHNCDYLICQRIKLFIFSGRDGKSVSFKQSALERVKWSAMKKVSSMDESLIENDKGGRLANFYIWQ